MARARPGPRKQRTRQHVIADLSVHHVEGFILEEGHTAQRLGSDYGYDLIMWTFDEHGYAEPGAVYFQFKAMETLEESGTDYAYDVDIRDYNLRVREEAGDDPWLGHTLEWATTSPPPPHNFGRPLPITDGRVLPLF